MSYSKGLWGVFTGTFVNVLVLYILHATDIIHVLGGVVETQGTEASTLWYTSVNFFLFIYFVVQIFISLITIWKYGWRGIIVPITGFLGWNMVIPALLNNALSVEFTVGVILVIISAAVAIIHGRRD